MEEGGVQSKSVYSGFVVPLLAGGLAGLTGDVVLFPLDTIKTRLQSKQGFLKAGGFKNIYAGLLPAAVGSVPSAATFFCAYELTKNVIGPSLPAGWAPIAHMAAATVGEVVSNLVRVPFELVKQRSQANRHLRPLQIVRQTLQQEGPRGMFRGYFSIIFRDIPFSFIQYPLWEYFKSSWSSFQGSPLQSWQAATCGAGAAAVASALTTPLDVAKTRIMLAKASDSEVKTSIFRVLITIGRTEGAAGLYSGFIPRVTWISIGGFVFLGAYDFSKQFLLKFNQD